MLMVMACGAEKLMCVLAVCETPCKYHAIINDNAMMLRVNEMYAERDVITWTSNDLHDKDVA